MLNKKHFDIVRKDRVQNLHPHPIVSCGKDEMALMQHMKTLGKELINIKDYSRVYYGTIDKRTKVYYYINKLIDKGLVSYPNLGVHKLTEFGNRYLEMSNRDVKSDRGECRKEGVNLSTHYIKYK